MEFVHQTVCLTFIDDEGNVEIAGFIDQMNALSFEDFERRSELMQNRSMCRPTRLTDAQPRSSLASQWCLKSSMRASMVESGKTLNQIKRGGYVVSEVLTNHADSVRFEARKYIGEETRRATCQGQSSRPTRCHVAPI